MALDRHGGLGNVFHGDIIAATDKPWQLQQCEPHLAAVNHSTKEARIPRILTEWDRQIARHERGHIRWNPDWTGHGLSPVEHQFAKDLWETVVNTRLEAGGLRVLDAVDAIDWDGMPRPSGVKDKLTAVLHVGSYYWLRPGGAADFRQFYQDVLGQVDHASPGVSTAVRNAVQDVALNAHASDIEVRVVNLAREFAKFCPPDNEFGTGARLKQDVAEQRAEAEREADAADQPSDSEADDAQEKTLTDGGSAFGLMYICDHTKSARRSARLTFRGRITDMGAIPTRLEREWTDGQIYSKSKPSLSVLIDGSGSMSWTPDQLMALCAAIPATTIASYNQSDVAIRRRGFPGTLCIYARAGVVAAKERLVQCTTPNSNTVDDYALAWLARQPMFRLWVSDGAVNYGNRAYGASSFAYGDECARLQRNARAVRVPTVQDALNAANGKAVHTYLTPILCSDVDPGAIEKLKITTARRRGR